MICGRIIAAFKAHPEALCIVFFELFQRYSYFGFQTLLFLYLKHELKFSLCSSIALYHIFQAIGFMFPVFFTVIADKCLSKYCTIMIAALITLVGDCVVVIAASAAGPAGLTSLYPHIIWLSSLGLVIRAIGSGGMREVVRTLGSDQFNLPQEEVHLRSYFKAYYCAMVFGTVAGIITMPLLRMHHNCAGEVYCFPLAFADATFSMFLAVLVLLCGCGSLNRGPPRGSPFVETLACVNTALRNRGARCGPTWLDNAGVMFTDSFICDVRATLRALLLFLPLPIFWALFEQQSTLWIYQATRMIWPLSRWEGLYVEPDHMPVLTHLFVFVIVAIYNTSLCSVCMRNIYCFRGALRQVVIGALLAALAFVVAGVIELKVEPTYAKLPKSGEATIVVHNAMTACPMFVKISYINSTYTREKVVGNLDNEFISNLPVEGTQSYEFYMRMMKAEYPGPCPGYGESTYRLALVEKRVHQIYVTFAWEVTVPQKLTYQVQDDLPFDIEKCDIQLPLNTLLYSSRITLNGFVKHDYVEITKKHPKMNTTVFMDSNHHGTKAIHMHPGEYGMNSLGGDDDSKFDFTVNRGGVYTMWFLQKNPASTALRNVTILTDPNSVHMEWQIPQYFIMALAYFFGPLTLLQYSYQQVPARMRPVLLAGWYCSLFFGNLLVAALACLALERMLFYYVIYACVMGGGVLVMIIIFCNFQDAVPEDEEEEDSED